MNAAAVKQSSLRTTVGGRSLDLHYRLAGSGPPLFLLHPSPFSSAFMVPLMRRLADRATVIAPDTPGFGESGTLPTDKENTVATMGEQPASGLAPYVQAMIALRTALRLDRIAVYGSATGAQIAIEWAKADTAAVHGVMLDNAASFTDTERTRIMDGYFPDLRPTADGAHLARAWQAAHDATLFFPWQHPPTAHRVAPKLGGAAVIDMSARAYLAAGPGYQTAYRAAFLNERAERIQPITAPLVIMRWRGSVLKPWSDRLDHLKVNKNVVMAHCGPTLEERWTCLGAHLDRILPGNLTTATSLCRNSGSIRYIDTDFGQIRYRMPDDAHDTGTGAHGSRTAPHRVDRDSNVVGIALHGLGGAGDLIDMPPGNHGWIRLDLPGHGGSAQPDGLSIDHCVDTLKRIADVLHVDAPTIRGAGTTARLARITAERDPRFHNTEADAPWFGGALPDLAPETSGAHLWRAWYWLRGQYLERNEAPPEPARLTRMLLALLNAQAAYRALQPALDASGPTDG